MPVLTVLLLSFIAGLIAGSFILPRWKKSSALTEDIQLWSAVILLIQLILVLGGEFLKPLFIGHLLFLGGFSLWCAMIGFALVGVYHLVLRSSESA